MLCGALTSYSISVRTSARLLSGAFGDPAVGASRSGGAATLALGCDDEHSP
jgi:hypothetical protein